MSDISLVSCILLFAIGNSTGLSFPTCYPTRSCYVTCGKHYTPLLSQTLHSALPPSVLLALAHEQQLLPFFSAILPHSFFQWKWKLGIKRQKGRNADLVEDSRGETNKKFSSKHQEIAAGSSNHFRKPVHCASSASTIWLGSSIFLWYVKDVLVYNWPIFHIPPN